MRLLCNVLVYDVRSPLTQSYMYPTQCQQVMGILVLKHLFLIFGGTCIRGA